MMRANVVISSQVSDRASQLQNPMIRASRQLQLAHRRAHQRVARAIQPAVLLHFARAHIGVRANAEVAEPHTLPLTSLLNTRADRR